MVHKALPSRFPHILLSQRAYVLLIEHARVAVHEGRVVFVVDKGEAQTEAFNVPDCNTVFLLLGKGSSITDAAIRMLSESNVMVGFCGSGGSPLIAAVDPVFLSSQSEYRPTEYMQAWMKMWLDDNKRLVVAKRMLTKRMEWTKKTWANNDDLKKQGIALNSGAEERFLSAVFAANDTEQLLSAEGVFAKTLYKALAEGFDFHFSRDPGAAKSNEKAEIANSLLDHGNYLAYGYAATVLHGLGISFALPVLHGKTRRGGLVFDVADLFKDGLVMPQAFISTNAGETDQEFRGRVIEVASDFELLDKVFDLIKEVCEE